jgi:hypothetical protein
MVLRKIMLKTITTEITAGALRMDEEYTCAL